MRNICKMMSEIVLVCFSLMTAKNLYATVIPVREKICINQLDSGTHFEGFVQSIHMNQKARQIPLSRVGVLSSLFVSFDLNHNSMLEDDEILLAKKTCKCYLGQATNSTNFPFLATNPLQEYPI